MNKKTLVLGASDKPERYSNMAIRMLQKYGHSIVAIGNKATTTHGITISKDLVKVTDIHTVTLYLNPTLQKNYYDYILTLQPQRIIFNPGTENDELYDLAKSHGILPVEACTLVMLQTGQY